MEAQFKLLELAQQNLAKQLDALTIEQINQIPTGFNNNLIWNFAHIVSAIQMLCYTRIGLATRLDETFVQRYKLGTKPEAFVTADEYSTYKQYATTGIEQLKADYANNHFKDFKPFTTSTGFEVGSIDYAINYALFHHGIHTGYAMAIKKLVVQ